MRAARPRQGTIVRWRSCRELLAALVEGRRPPAQWSSLSPAQQEAACAEYLRERHEGRPELPVIKRLLLPVGRTLEDVDVYGLCEGGEEVFAQVTHLECGSEEARKKVERLKEYAGDGTRKVRLVFFCQGSVPAAEDEIAFVSTDKEVLPWILKDADYRNGLFGGV